MIIPEEVNFRKMSRTQLLVALLTAALDFFHLGLVYPIFAEMLSDSSSPLNFGEGAWERSLYYSCLIAAFPLGQFLGSPILGKLSDRYGRRSLLLITIAGSGVGMAICGLGVMLSIPFLILLGRLSGGLMGANLSLAYATIADNSNSSNKVKNMALIPLSTSTGFALGPLMTGLLGDTQSYPIVGETLPFWIAVALTLVNWILVYRVFEDRLPLSNSPSQSSKLSLFKHNKLWTPIALTFLMVSANFLLIQFVGPYSTIKLDADLTTISWIYVNLSVSVGIGHIFLTRKIASVAQPQTVLPWSLGALAIALLAVSYSSTLLVLHFTLVLAMLCCAIAYTNVFAYLSDHASAENQGAIMGLGVSVQCLAEWLPPLCIGAFALSYPGMPMIVGAIACVLGVGLMQKRKIQEISLMKS